MKIATCSDLHLEHYAKLPNFGLSGGFLNNEAEADVLVLAGDILVAEHMHKSPLVHSVFHALSRSYKDVLYVMGNHEHYHGDFKKTPGYINTMLSPYPNIKLLDKESVKIGDLNFFGGTLWTDFNKKDPLCMWDARNYMNDYRVVKNGLTKPFLPEDAIADHIECLGLLRAELTQNPGEDFVVITHHSPSWQMVEDHYVSDNLTGAYHNDLDGFIAEHPQIITWLFGHAHDRNVKQIEQCAVVINSRGYPGQLPGEFKPAIVEL